MLGIISISYPNKKSEEEILKNIEMKELISINKKTKAINKLILGENRIVLKNLLQKYHSKIDLVYIDPPYATKNVFTISNEKANAISRSETDDIAYSDDLLGPEYIEYIREVLVLLKELLSEKGSIYIHIDYKIGHYIKIICDEIFGKDNFLNDIARIKCNPKNFEKRSFGNIKDMILFYSKSQNHIWNDPKIEMTEKDQNRLFKKIDKDGRRYTTVPVHAPGETKNGVTGKPWRGMNPPKGRHWRVDPEKLDELDQQGLIEWSKTGVPRKKIFFDENEGKRVQDIIEFKDSQNPSYPTEKNLDLLKFLINTSSNKDSLVLDCFCGSGTTLKAAEELGRKWIGIDKSKTAIEIAYRKIWKKQARLLEENDFEYLQIK